MIEIPMEVSASDVEIPAELSISVPPGHNVKIGSQYQRGGAGHFILDLGDFDFVPKYVLLYRKGVKSSSNITVRQACRIIDWTSGGDKLTVTYDSFSSGQYSGTTTTTYSTSSVTHNPPESGSGSGTLDFYLGSTSVQFLSQIFYYIAWD